MTRTSCQPYSGEYLMVDLMVKEIKQLFNLTIREFTSTAPQNGRGVTATIDGMKIEHFLRALSLGTSAPIEFEPWLAREEVRLDGLDLTDDLPSLWRVPDHPKMLQPIPYALRWGQRARMRCT